MLFYVTMNMVAVAVKAVGITMKQKQQRRGTGGLTMTENKMEQVAQMFGKKLNEDFKAVIWDSIMECRFTNEGLEIKLDNGLYRNNGNWLSCLLTGEAEIVEDE